MDISIRNQSVSSHPSFHVQYHIHPGYAENYLQLKKNVSAIMMKDAGIVRNKTLLEEGLQTIRELRQHTAHEEYEYYSLLCDNLLTVAELIICSALYREESRGGHFREDFPQSDDDKFLVHIVQQKDQPISTIPVNTCK